MRLQAYSDADWNGEVDKHLSTTGWIIFMGDAPISWASRTQRCTAKSTAEAEYVAAASCAQEVIYLQMLAASMNNPTATVELFSNEGTEDQPGCVQRWREWVSMQQEHGTIHTDSMNAIANASMPAGWLQEALRHIRTHFHFVKQFVLDKSIDLLHCRGDVNCADIFTKGFGTSKSSGTVNQRSEVFRKHAKFCLGMRDWSRSGPNVTTCTAKSTE